MITSICKWYYNICMVIILLVYYPILVSSFPSGIQTDIAESDILSQAGIYSCSLCHSSKVKEAIVSSTDVIANCSTSDAIFAGVKLNGISDATISLGAFGFTSVAFNKVYCDFTVDELSLIHI